MIVGRQRFIVHPAVEAGEIGQIAQCADFAVGKRIEQADFDVVFGIQCRQHVIHTARIIVVEQQAHADAPLGGALQHLEQHFARYIVMPDVIGNIQRTVGMLNQHGTGDKSITRVGQQINTALPRLFFRRPLGRQRGFQTRRAVRIDIAGNAAVGQIRQTRTGRQQQRRGSRQASGRQTPRRYFPYSVQNLALIFYRIRFQTAYFLRKARFTISHQSFLPNTGRCSKTL